MVPYAVLNVSLYSILSRVLVLVIPGARSYVLWQETFSNKKKNLNIFSFPSGPQILLPPLDTMYYGALAKKSIIHFSLHFCFLLRRSKGRLWSFYTVFFFIQEVYFFTKKLSRSSKTNLWPAMFGWAGCREEIRRELGDYRVRCY